MCKAIQGGQKLSLSFNRYTQKQRKQQGFETHFLEFCSGAIGGYINDPLSVWLLAIA